jgi:hypothetical protein
MKDKVDKKLKTREGQEKYDSGGKYEGQGRQETKDERGTGLDKPEERKRDLVKLSLVKMQMSNCDTILFCHQNNLFVHCKERK